VIRTAIDMAPMRRPETQLESQHKRISGRHHRHETRSAKAPTSKGPATDAIPHMPPNISKTRGRLAGGTVSLVNEGRVSMTDITRAPENIPPTPMPAINAVLEDAAPHIREPN
jgi:hypothetical protein